jgi:alkane 1-monooxygenase
MTSIPANPAVSPTALLRLVPYSFSAIFVLAAVAGSISVLYAAVALHLTIIAGENTLGRRLASMPVAPLRQGSALFEEACLLAWPWAHAAALIAALYLIIQSQPTARQTFALGAIFGYSINIFSATVGHELLHRNSPVARRCAGILYAAMLYPHFPAVHLASHHRWAGTERDCQTPLPGQQIYPYLGRAFVGGWRIAMSARAAALAPYPGWRIAAGVAAPAALALLGAHSAAVFLVIQGLFAFIVIETLNYIQHFRAVGAGGERATLANQDVNFISRCVLFNLPLHASHHCDEQSVYPLLRPIAGAPSYCWGYWTSFWLAWTPPLWNHFHNRKAHGEIPT